MAQQSLLQDYKKLQSSPLLQTGKSTQLLNIHLNVIHLSLPYTLLYNNNMINTAQIIHFLRICCILLLNSARESKLNLILNYLAIMQ